MSDTSPFGFGHFVPGFDFMQNLAKGASLGMPPLSGWVAPTVSIEELDKRIAELKAVHFWLEQNARALTATMQALQVQRMTLSTLQSMNVAMGDVAQAFSTGAAQQSAAAKTPQASPSHAPPSDAPEATQASAAAAAMVDPVQWWSALTSQFQNIAAKAVQEVQVPPQAEAEAEASSSTADPAPAKTEAAKRKKPPAKKAAPK